MTQWQALRIARTEMNRAHREASLQSYAANQDVVTAWVWSAACDRRTCAGCWVMQGSEHPLSERLDDHPNGRCVAIPKTKSWGELLGDDTILDTRPKVSEGSELWAETPEDLQKEILGDSLYEAWRGGKVFWEDLVSQDSDPRWGTTRRAATLAEALERAEARRNAEALVNAGE
jgi:hypothetical protein